MNRIPGLIHLFAILIICITAASADLSFLVLVSEDEIINAYESGEISYSQMILLIEIKEEGLNPDNIHLLDDIPNLSYFINENPTLKTELYREQLSSFIVQPPPQKKSTDFSGSIKYNYYQHIEDDPETRYNSTVKYQYGDKLFFDNRYRKEYSGAKRITYRSFKYINKKGHLTNLTIGNFTKRFGLGTIIGHRGKLLDYSKQLDGESFLFPDYGGYNGIYKMIENNKFRMQSLFSYNRDTNYSLSTYGFMLTRKPAKIKPSLILGFNKIKNRTTGESFDDIKLGINNTYRYKNGYNALELTMQNDDKYRLATFITEGKHRFREAEIKYSGWIYEHDLIDLSMGSKYVYLPSKDTIDNTEYIYTNKRSGQKGMLLKTDVALNETMKLSNSLLLAFKNRDSLDVQHATTLSKHFSKSYFVSINYLSKYKRRERLSAGDATTRRQTSIELRYRADNTYWRNNIGYLTETNHRDYLSLFSNLIIEIPDQNIFEIWINISKIDLNKRQLEYWNAFVRIENMLAKKIKMDVKLSQTFNKYSDKRHKTIISFELNIIL